MVLGTRRTRHKNDHTPVLSLSLTERQFNAVFEALRELSLLAEYYYPVMNVDDKVALKFALRELDKSRTWNLLQAVRDGRV